MCIIVSKKRGIDLPGKEILLNCFNYNSDGCGFMYNDGYNVYIEKGFMDFNSFYNRLIEINKRIDLKYSDVAIHFRISTSGNIDQGNTHPYMISNIDDNLRALNIVTDIGMVHNGIIKKHIPHKNSILNDTQTFIKNYVYNMYKNDNNFLSNDDNIKLLELEASSKLCFITSNSMYCIGKFIEEENGVLYSNESYLPPVYTFNDYYYTDDLYNYLDMDGNIDFNYFDMFDVDGIPLEIEDFYLLLDNLIFLDANQDIQIDGKRYTNNSDIVLDKYNCVYQVDYTNLCFNYLGEIM